MGFFSLSTSVAAIIVTNKNYIAEVVLLWENIAELLFGWIYNISIYFSVSKHLQFKGNMQFGSYRSADTLRLDYKTVI